MLLENKQVDPHWALPQVKAMSRKLHRLTQCIRQPFGSTPSSEDMFPPEMEDTADDFAAGPVQALVKHLIQSSPAAIKTPPNRPPVHHMLLLNQHDRPRRCSRLNRSSHHPCTFWFLITDLDTAYALSSKWKVSILLLPFVFIVITRIQRVLLLLQVRCIRPLLFLHLQERKLPREVSIAGCSDHDLDA